MKRFALLILMSILLTGCLVPVRDNAPDGLPLLKLAPADEIWLHGYGRATFDICMQQMAVLQNNSAIQDRYAIQRECQRIADDVAIQVRAKLYLQENYPTPTPEMKLPQSSGT